MIFLLLAAAITAFQCTTAVVQNYINPQQRRHRAFRDNNLENTDIDHITALPDHLKKQIWTRLDKKQIAQLTTLSKPVMHSIKNELPAFKYHKEIYAKCDKLGNMILHDLFSSSRTSESFEGTYDIAKIEDECAKAVSQVCKYWNVPRFNSNYKSQSLQELRIIVKDLKGLGKLKALMYCKMSLEFIKSDSDSTVQFKADDADILSSVLSNPDNQITSLSFDKVNLGYNGAVELSKSFATNRNIKLRSLDFRNTKITNPGASSLADGLSKLNSPLLSVTFHDENLSDTEISELITAILENETLRSAIQELELSGNHFGRASMESLKRLIRSRENNLLTLDLSKTELNNELTEILASAISSPNNRITGLTLNSNNIELDGFNSIAEALKSPNNGVFELSLSENRGRNDGCVALARALASTNCLLETLALNQNEITDEGVVALSEGMKSEHCQLAVLELERNQITVEGAAALAGIMKYENNQLAKLWLASNEITDGGADIISEALSSPNNVLVELDLSENHINQIGACVIAQALNSNNCHLESLTLDWNNIQSSGAEELARSLMKSPNSQLQELSLIGNQIRDLGVYEFTRFLMKRRKDSFSLDLQQNMIGYDGAYKMVKSVSTIEPENNSVILIDLRDNPLHKRNDAGPVDNSNRRLIIQDLADSCPSLSLLI